MTLQSTIAAIRKSIHFQTEIFGPEQIVQGQILSLISVTENDTIFLLGGDGVEKQNAVLEYKCPSCGAGLVFGQDQQKMTCQYCDNEFEIEAVKAYNDALAQEDSNLFTWADKEQAGWSEAEQAAVRTYSCQSCGGTLITDHATAATFCPYCENPAILPGRLSGGLKPDGVIPFQTGKEDAINAFLVLCKGKPLLPKEFMQQHRIEKITGIYVPFWLYDCDSRFHGTYKATRIHHWSDANYHYTKTDHFLLDRGCIAGFLDIPADASSKLDDVIMESIEPFDYSKMIDFHTAYLSGFFADKYDVEAQAGAERVRQRVQNSIDELLSNTLIGYASVLPTSKNLHIDRLNANYVLLPVWMLHTKYKDKTYVFAMNGQTGKITGTFPICPKRTAAWFAGICAAVTAVAAIVQLLMF